MHKYDVAVVGFALANCPNCHGTGRLGYTRGVDEGQVTPCHCVVFWEYSRLKAEAAKDAGQQEQRGTKDSKQKP